MQILLRLNSKFELVEERISKLDDTLIKIMYSRKRKK
jgi:uncharacterized protein YPO0396